MTHRTGGKVARPRVCARCKGPISETRPVFLVADYGGKITGPYHAGCAQRVKLDQEAHPQHDAPTADLYGRWPVKIDEEGEPW
jgi:hypothetical protein